jgi:hypothetical protein
VLRLALTGAIKDSLLDEMELIHYLLYIMNTRFVSAVTPLSSFLACACWSYPVLFLLVYDIVFLYIRDLQQLSTCVRWIRLICLLIACLSPNRRKEHAYVDLFRMKGPTEHAGVLLQAVGERLGFVMSRKEAEVRVLLI